MLAPSPFNTCMGWVLGRVVDQSHCGASVGNSKITDFVFADEAVVFGESLEILVMPLEALHKEVKPLEVQVSWPKASRFRCLKTNWMKQYSLSMCVARTLRSSETSHTFVV